MSDNVERVLSNTSFVPLRNDVSEKQEFHYEPIKLKRLPFFKFLLNKQARKVFNQNIHSTVVEYLVSKTNNRVTVPFVGKAYGSEYDRKVQLCQYAQVTIEYKNVFQKWIMVFKSMRQLAKMFNALVESRDVFLGVMLPPSIMHVASFDESGEYPVDKNGREIFLNLGVDRINGRLKAREHRQSTNFYQRSEIVFFFPTEKSKDELNAFMKEHYFVNEGEHSYITLRY